MHQINFHTTHAGLEDEDEEAQAGAAGDRGGPSRRDMDEFDNVDVEEDEFADFLDYDEEGGPPGEGRRRQRTRIVGLPPGVSSAALQVQHLHACQHCLAAWMPGSRCGLPCLMALRSVPMMQ